VFDSRGLPDYPPAQNAWQFPPPPISPRWKWAAIAAMVFGLVGGSTMLAITIALGSSGAPGLIDNTELISVIEQQCYQMTTKVDSLPIHGTPRRQAQTIAAQNSAIDDMVTDIRSVGPDVLASDPPSEEWLDDWERLVQAREAYAREILGGSQRPYLDIPTDEDGNDIYLRMNDAFLGESSCEVPDAVLNPYPDGSSEA
jgi:hypothetical protein